MRHDATASFQANLKLIAAKLENAAIGSQLAERGVGEATDLLERLTSNLPFPAQGLASNPTLNSATDRLFCRVKEAAEMLGLSERSIWRLINDGTLDSIQQGRARLIRIESLNRL